MADYFRQMIVEEILRRNESLMQRDPIFAQSDRKHLINRHMAVVRDLRDQQPGKYLGNSTCKAPNVSFPTIPLEKTNMIDIEQILRSGIDFVHQGKFILCRLILPSIKMPAHQMLIDDPAGHRCLRVTLHNYEGTIRPGSILAIMHPWFKKSADKLADIRVENPMHLHIFDGDEQLLQKIDWKAPMPTESGVAEMKTRGDIDWGEEGKWHFVDKNYGRAIHYFSKAIQIQPQNPIFYSNRALAYLKIQNPQLALEDTEMGLKFEPTNVKMLYRKGKALAMLNRYEEAIDVLENGKKSIKNLLFVHQYEGSIGFVEHVTKIMKEFTAKPTSAIRDKATSDEKVFVQLINDVKRMRREHENGEYDIVAMEEEAKKSKILENHTDFVAADKFEVKEIAGKGRGLVAKKIIPQGTLLMASKAFVFADFANLDTKTAYDSSHLAEFRDFLVKKVCEKISANPELAEDFYKLYAGENFDLLEKIDGSNPLDIGRISNIVRRNTFGSNSHQESNPHVTDKGIWVMQSYLNHSCVDNNCFRFVVGDFAFIRSQKIINPGEELVIGYVPGSRLYQKRVESLRQEFDFECTCRLCQADASESEEIRNRYVEIYAILEKFQNKYEGRKPVVTKAEKKADITLLENLLKEVIEYRPDLSINFKAIRVQKALFGVSLHAKPEIAAGILEEIFENRLQANDLINALMYAKMIINGYKYPDLEWGKWITESKRLAKILFGDEREADTIAFHGI